MQQMEENQKLLSGFNMSDSSKTIDGTPIEKILGYNPMEKSHEIDKVNVTTHANTENNSP